MNGIGDARFTRDQPRDGVADWHVDTVGARRGKDLLVAYMPFKVHMHRVVSDLVQPWTHTYLRHPFMRDTWRFIDVEPRP